MTYAVSTITRDDAGNLVFGARKNFNTKPAAIDAAKRAAGRGAKFDGAYGPDAVAYRGRDITAVVAW